jgi:hypothetical protein
MREENKLVLRARQFYATRIMELSKYPLEKVFFFVAGIIPGLVALLIYHFAVPGSFEWFFSMGFLGYKTKLGIILLTAFVLGNSMTTFLNAILGAAGGVLGAIHAQQPFKPAHSYDIAPWRDQLWRSTLKKRLGEQSPADTLLLRDDLFNMKRESLNLLPEIERPAALSGLNIERLESEMNDGKWSQWYDHYHHIVLTSRERWDVQSHVFHGLNFNLETTALYALVSSALVPGLRHWWCILPASLWTLLLAAQQYNDVRRYRDKWSTLSAQIEYISKDDGNQKTTEEAPQ